MEENATKLANHVHRSESGLKAAATNEYQKIQQIIDGCPLCHHEDRHTGPQAPLVALGTRVYLTLPTEPEMADGGACIVPIEHHVNLLECDDDEWEEIRVRVRADTRDALADCHRTL